MYVIREVAPYSRYAPFATLKVRGMTMGIYATDQQPYSIDESELEQSVAQLWYTIDKPLQFLREMRRLNGTERKPNEG